MDVDEKTVTGMAEYIEREAAYREICSDETMSGFEKAYCSELIRNIPAADVAPVVRCKDCKYWQDNNDGYPHEECRCGHGETPDANDFCNYGERKEGDD